MWGLGSLLTIGGNAGLVVFFFNPACFQARGALPREAVRGDARGDGRAAAEHDARGHQGEPLLVPARQEPVAALDAGVKNKKTKKDKAKRQRTTDDADADDDDESRSNVNGCKYITNADAANIYKGATTQCASDLRTTIINYAM